MQPPYRHAALAGSSHRLVVNASAPVQADDAKEKCFGISMAGYAAIVPRPAATPAPVSRRWITTRVPGGWCPRSSCRNHDDQIAGRCRACRFPEAD